MLVVRGAEIDQVGAMENISIDVYAEMNSRMVSNRRSSKARVARRCDSSPWIPFRDPRYLRYLNENV